MNHISVNDKKGIGIYSNCQGQIIEYFLKTIFTECSFHYFENFSMISNAKIGVKKYKEQLRNCDIFIYQPINQKGYGGFNTIDEGIFQYLKKGVIKISFPYIYNNSLWDLKKILTRDNQSAIWKLNGGIKTRIWEINNKEVIENIIEKNPDISLNKLIEMYKTNKIDFKYKERYEKSLNILKEKEKDCDVKVSDYIEENIYKKRLFFTFNHPCNSVIIHCVNQILNLLGVKKVLYEKDFPSIVVRAQKKGFYTFSQNDFLNNGILFDEDIDLKSSIKLIKEIYASYKK